MNDGTINLLHFYENANQPLPTDISSCDDSSEDDCSGYERENSLRETRIATTIVAHNMKKLVVMKVQLFATDNCKYIWVNILFLYALSFDNVVSLYRYYERRTLQAISDEPVASLRTFKRAFDAMKTSFALMRCKGSFPTCEHCKRAQQLMVSDQFSANQMEMISKYTEEHLTNRLDKVSYLLSVTYYLP